MSNRYYENLKRPVALLLLYFLVEIMFSFFLIPFYALQGINKEEVNGLCTTSYIAVICVSIISLFVTICFAKYYLKMFKWHDIIKPMGTNMLWATILVAASVFGIIGLNIISEIVNLPDLNKDFFRDNSQHFWGVIVASIVAPIGEEILFRSACLGWMQAKGVNTILAILFSSIIFGIVHLNPIQIFFATGLGVILGLLYWYSRSLILPIVVHVINNTMSSCVNIFNSDFKISELFDNIIVSLGFSTLCLVVCAFSFWRFIMVNRCQPK